MPEQLVRFLVSKTGESCNRRKTRNRNQLFRTSVEQMLEQATVLRGRSVNSCDATVAEVGGII